MSEQKAAENNHLESFFRSRLQAHLQLPRLRRQKFAAAPHAPLSPVASLSLSGGVVLYLIALLLFRAIGRR